MFGKEKTHLEQMETGPVGVLESTGRVRGTQKVGSNCGQLGAVCGFSGIYVQLSHPDSPVVFRVEGETVWSLGFRAQGPLVLTTLESCS